MKQVRQKITALLLALALASAAAGCADTQETSQNTGKNQELIVFAAASMTETLNELNPVFEKENPGVKLTCNFDSSGTLKTQIQEGAACDVFISAGQTQVNQLDDTGDILDGSRINLLENKVVLCVPEGNPCALESFSDMATTLENQEMLLCMGNSDVPAGQYAQRILAYYGLDENALAQGGAITYASNVKEVTTQITEGSVDAGIVYATDAYSADLTPLDYATEEMCGQVIYPAAVLKNATQPELARAYLTFLTSDEAMTVFERVGFSPAA